MKTVARQSLRKRTGAGQRSDLMTVLVACVSIALPMLFHVHQHVEMLQYGYEIEALKTRREVLVERQRELRGRRAQWAEFARVEEGARRLGLSVPRPEDLLAVGSAARTVSTALLEGNARLD